MATVTLQGNPVETIGSLPSNGTKAPEFSLVKPDLSELKLADLNGKRVVLNIFPSIDTGTCAASVRAFNQKAAALDNTLVLCVSMDLPFANGRFCGAEGIDKVQALSGFRSTFGQDYGVTFANGPLVGLYSRCVVVVGEDGNICYTQQVSEIVDEPDYDAALAALA